MLDPLGRAAELDRAYRTLCRGARFFASPAGQGAPPPEIAAPISHRHRSKWIGNGLRELDRFLHHLLDAVAHAHGLGAAPDQRNSANKLRALRATLGHGGDDHARLLALGGTRACLFHCDGILRSHAMATACWSGLGRSSTPPAPERGAMLIVVPADLRCVGHFYQGLAEDLVQRP
ncbi:hypothetical protein [Sphingomonas sp. TDK1]|uniref:hypothetical protein n=1 Tax=Sphingomonas sp. TDK1 TaxID=453247 RepID=UPI0007D9E10D|nr:hypothetical protein [Sphingomonas sp. TDK1]OAN67099.1 hypothetical protein A7X12_00240 [Sphingomonas sp. TDK1]